MANNNMFLGNNSLNNFMSNTGFIAKATPTNSVISDAAKKSINDYVDSLGLQGMDKQLKIQELTQKTLQTKRQQEYNQGRADVKNDLAWKAMNTSNKEEAQAYKSQGKLADLADMVRGYIKNAEGRDIVGNDDEIVASFLKDNQAMVAPFASYMAGEQSAYEFAKLYGFDATSEEIATDKRTKGWRSSLTTDEGEWNDDILGHFDYESYDEAGEGFWNKAGTFGLNLLKSTYNLGSDVVNMVANPIDTTNNLAKMLVGGVMNLTTLDDYLDPEGEGWINSANQMADGLGDVLKERYGSWDAIKNTAYTDPMGMASDIASIIEGGAGLVRGVSKGAAIGATKAGMKGTASNLEKTASYASKVANIAHKADPFVEMMEGGAKGLSYVGNKAINSKTAGKIKNSATNLTDSIVGLDNETKKAIQSNPYAGSTWRQVENYIDENGLPTRSQEVSKSLIGDLATAVQEDLKSYINQFNETGPLYKSLKNGNYSVDLTNAEYKAKLDNFLEEKGVVIGKDGSLDFSDTAVTPTEASAIRRAYSWLSPNEAQPVSQYLRHRKGIDQLGLWEDAKGTPGKEILKGMREFANEEAHSQIQPLKELDKLYSEQVDLLNKATEGLVYRDKRRFGEYRDNFNQILKNMDTPNRKRLKDRLEKILPGLEQKVSAINLMPKLIDNYYRPGKADKRLSSAGGIVGTALGGGVPGLAVGAGVGYGLSKLYDKIKTNRWDKAISNLSEEGKTKMAEIEKAIANNKVLSTEQAESLKAIARELKANKAVKEGQIAEIMGRLSEVENIDQLDGLMSELRKIGADDVVKELEGIKEQAVKNMTEQAEMDRYAEEFEAEKQNIINESADQRLPEFKRRIYQLGQEERRIGSVAGKKIGKTFEGKDYHRQQQTEWLRKKEAVIKEIQDYYNVDQFEASEIYDRIERQAGPDDLGFSESQASSKTAKYQVADEIKEGAYNPRASLPKPRGGWTKAKIEKQIKEPITAKQKGVVAALEAIQEFDNAEDFKAHTFYHGTQGSFVGKPSMSIPEKTFDRIADQFGGGYGQRYWAISLTTDKKIASRFGGASDHVNINPVILRKNAKVIEMPELTDSIDLEDHIERLWNEGVDAVWIGDKNAGEKELAVLNPKAIVDLDAPDSYRAYMLGSKDNPLKIKSDEDFNRIYESAPKYRQELKDISREFGGASDRWAMNKYGKTMTDELLNGDINIYREMKKEWENSAEKIKADEAKRNYNEKLYDVKQDIRFQKYGVAGEGEKGISATEGLNIRNFKNGKTVQELANQYGIDTKIVDSISTPEGQRAYGMYGDRLITLSKDLKESTVPHELLHGVFDMVDSKRRTSILEGIQKKLNIDNVQAEEWLADNFSEYYRTGKFGTKGLAKGLVEKVKQFFYQVKSYIDGTYKNEKQIRQLFDDIIDGKIEGEYGVYSDPKFQSVWHGSPADFERFDSLHMGEGEGNQAHGWGHYVAVEEGTARHYAEMQSEYGDNLKYKGKEINYEGEEGEVANMLAEQLDFDNLSEIETVKDNVRENLRADREEALSEGDKARVKELDKMIKMVDDFNVEGGKNLYEVEIPDPIKKDTPTGSNYWEEWDSNYTKEQIEKIGKELAKKIEGKPLEQATMKDVENIAKAMHNKLSPDAQKMFVENVKEWVDKGHDIKTAIEDNMAYYTSLSSTADGWLEAAGLRPQGKYYDAIQLWRQGSQGRNIYTKISSILGGDKEASKFLESLGYDGIHYFGGTDGEAYVIFNDDALEITKHHKY